MKKEDEACWICRRTKKELLQQIKKDGMEDYIGEGQILYKISMFDCDYTKYVCNTCNYMIQKIVDDELKSLIDDEILKVSFDTS